MSPLLGFGYWCHLRSGCAFIFDSTLSLGSLHARIGNIPVYARWFCSSPKFTVLWKTWTSSRMPNLDTSRSAVNDIRAFTKGWACDLSIAWFLGVICSAALSIKRKFQYSEICCHPKLRQEVKILKIFTDQKALENGDSPGQTWPMFWSSCNGDSWELHFRCRMLCGLRSPARRQQGASMSAETVWPILEYRARPRSLDCRAVWGIRHVNSSFYEILPQLRQAEVSVQFNTSFRKTLKGKKNNKKTDYKKIKKVPLKSIWKKNTHNGAEVCVVETCQDC